MITVHTLNDRICAHFNDAGHAAEVPAGARMLFCNGQVGAEPDGTVPESPKDQVQVIFERIQAILTNTDMTFDDVVKLTLYVTDKAIIDDYQSARDHFMGAHNPPAVILIVPEFPRPGVEVEIEVVAAKEEV